MKQLTFALSFGIIAFSGTTMADPQWSGALTITEIQVLDNSARGTGPERIYLKFNAAPFTVPCDSPGSGWWAIGGLKPDNVKNILTEATAAKLAGRQVLVYWNQGASNQCDVGGYPVVVGLVLQ